MASIHEGIFTLVAAPDAGTRHTQQPGFSYPGSRDMMACGLTNEEISLEACGEEGPPSSRFLSSRGLTATSPQAPDGTETLHIFFTASSVFLHGSI